MRKRVVIEKDAVYELDEDCLEREKQKSGKKEKQKSRERAEKKSS